MASGISRVVRGSVVGTTGVAIDVKTVGFRPRTVTLFNASGDEAVWHSTMADAAAFKRVVGGAGAMISSNGVTPLADGFTIGTDGDLNVDTEVIYWEAVE